MSSVSVGISITGSRTDMRIRRINDGSLVAQLSTNTPAEYAELIVAIQTMIEKHRTNDAVRAVAVGISGTIKQKRLRNSELGWDGRNLEHGLHSRLKVATVLVQPLASMAAIGEYSIGDSPIRRVACVDWGNHFIAASTRDGANASVTGGISSVSSLIAGRHLEDRFGRPLGKLRGPEWDTLTREFVAVLHAIVDQSGCNHIVLSGFVMNYLTRLFTVEGIKAGFDNWQGESYRHVELASPGCSNPALHGADLTAQRLAR